MEFNSLLKECNLEREFPNFYLPEPEVPKLLNWFIQQKKFNEFHAYLLLKNIELSIEYFNTALAQKLPKQMVETLVRQMDILSIQMNKTTFELLLRHGYDVHLVVKLMERHNFHPTIEIAQIMIESLVQKKEYEDALYFIKNCDQVHAFQLYDTLLGKTSDLNASKFILYDVFNNIERVGELDTLLIKRLLRHAFKVKDLVFMMYLFKRFGSHKSLELEFRKFEQLSPIISKELQLKLKSQ